MPAATAIYQDLTDGLQRDLRVEELVFLAAERHPDLLPSRAEIAAERTLKQAEKRGAELRQGDFLAALLADPVTGGHLVRSMLRPRRQSRERLDELLRSGRVDLGLATVERKGNVGEVCLRNPEYLNAEDDLATAALEVGVDLVLMDPSIEVGVLRGAVVDHPRHAGRRVFNAGINLTHLYFGRISFVDFFIARELGLLNKLYRGLWLEEEWLGPLENTVEKPWIAAVESFAIGGGCQLLLVMDRVLAERGAYFSLPARREGIIPGAANLRLSRFLGERAARQAIMFERSFAADGPDGHLLCDRVVEREDMDAAIAADAAQLTSSGVVSAAANRKALRAAAEPLDLFRSYLAVYAREQVRCLYSPALIDNLERNWQASRRRLKERAGT